MQRAQRWGERTREPINHLSPLISADGHFHRRKRRQQRGEKASDHFVDITEMVGIGSGARRGLYALLLESSAWRSFTQLNLRNLQ
jgi:hypothetical protein